MDHLPFILTYIIIFVIGFLSVMHELFKDEITSYRRGRIKTITELQFNACKRMCLICGVLCLISNALLLGVIFYYTIELQTMGNVWHFVGGLSIYAIGGVLGNAAFNGLIKYNY